MSNAVHNSAVCVVGAGSWGTALAMVLARSGHDTRLLTESAQDALAINTTGENGRYLPDLPLPLGLVAMADYDTALKGVAAVVVAVPCAAIDAVLPKIVARFDGTVIAACKGLHPQTLERTDQMLARYLPPERITILSGPSFAREVAQGKPTAIVMAAADESLAKAAASLFADSSFRIYSSTDVVGVALGGALKNVIAVAAGVAQGMGLGHNAAAALITRGIVEITQLAVACGAKGSTMSGLAGLGDLVLTCTGELSRNRGLGMRLASGATLSEAKAAIGQAVEGVRTAEAAVQLGDRYGLEIPIIRAVQALVQGRIAPAEAVERLMQRPEKAEF